MARLVIAFDLPCKKSGIRSRAYCTMVCPPLKPRELDSKVKGAGLVCKTKYSGFKMWVQVDDM